MAKSVYISNLVLFGEKSIRHVRALRQAREHHCDFPGKVKFSRFLGSSISRRNSLGMVDRIEGSQSGDVVRRLRQSRAPGLR